MLGMLEERSEYEVWYYTNHGFEVRKIFVGTYRKVIVLAEAFATTYGYEIKCINERKKFPKKQKRIVFKNKKKREM